MPDDPRLDGAQREPETYDRRRHHTTLYGVAMLIALAAVGTIQLFLR